MTCHQAHGKGLGVIYPTLVGSPWVLGSEERLAKMVLHGLWGPMTVNGQTYDPARGVPPMTAFRAILKDDEVAAVMTFVRNTWGNRASATSPDLVKKVRQETASRSTFWSPDDLLAAHPLEPDLVAASAQHATPLVMNTALEAELVAADPRELARLARERGDVERGRKVFLDARTTCAACHQPPAGVQRLGPNLAELPTKLADVELVESILAPSKRIEKEYVQLVVVTDDGKQRIGMKVEENDGEVVLRNPVQPEPIRIAKKAIDEVLESPVSIMPAGLVRMLENRQEFDDLLRFVLETRSRP